MGYPVVNLGQSTFDIPYYRKLLREACGNWDFYQTLAQTDPDYEDTAAWYADLCQERQAALTRAIQAIAAQETPLALEGAELGWWWRRRRRPYLLMEGIGTRVLGR